MMMKLNLGTLDRWLRIVLGLFILSLGFWGPQTPWAWLGLVPFVTGLFGHCPLYTILGISSCPRDKSASGGSRRR